MTDRIDIIRILDDATFWWLKEHEMCIEDERVEIKVGNKLLCHTCNEWCVLGAEKKVD